MHSYAPIRYVFCIFLKDLRVARKWLLIITPFYLVYAAQFFSITPLYLIVNMLNTFVLAMGVTIIDDYHKAHTLLCSMPVRRRTLVAARYFSSILMLTLGMAACFAYGLLLNRFVTIDYGSFDLSLIGSTIVPYLAITALLLCLFFPFYFRFGILKGVIVFTISVTALVVLSVGLLSLLRAIGIESIGTWVQSISEPRGMAIFTIVSRMRDAIAPALFVPLVCGFLGAVLAISVLLSIRYYEKREF